MRRFYKKFVDKGQGPICSSNLKSPHFLLREVRRSDHKTSGVNKQLSHFYNYHESPTQM